MPGPGNELSPPPHCARLSAFHHFQSIKQPAARESCRWVTSQHLTSFRRWGKGKKSTFLIGDINNAEEEIKLKGFSFPKWICRMWLPSWAAVRRSSSGSQGGNSERVTLRCEVLCRVRDTADPHRQDALFTSRAGETRGAASLCSRRLWVSQQTEGDRHWVSIQEGKPLISRDLHLALAKLQRPLSCQEPPRRPSPYYVCLAGFRKTAQCFVFPAQPPHEEK